MQAQNRSVLDKFYLLKRGVREGRIGKQEETKIEAMRRIDDYGAVDNMLESQNS